MHEHVQEVAELEMGTCLLSGNEKGIMRDYGRTRCWIPRADKSTVEKNSRIVDVSKSWNLCATEAEVRET